MARYIDVENFDVFDYFVIQELEKFGWEDASENKDAIHAFADGVSFVLSKIDDVPDADVKPVVHAHWIRRKCEWGYLGRNCSTCGYLDFLEKVGNYCPNCGAKMDEEVDNG